MCVAQGHNAVTLVNTTLTLILLIQFKSNVLAHLVMLQYI